MNRLHERLTYHKSRLFDGIHVTHGNSWEGQLPLRQHLHPDIDWPGEVEDADIDKVPEEEARRQQRH